MADKREIMEKMWRYRTNIPVQAVRFIVLALKFAKLIKKSSH